MFGLDESIAALGESGGLLVLLGVATLLGLRHATDPDHLAAVSTLVACDRDRGARRASGLGLAWGLGHATTLFSLGLPIVLFEGYLPEEVQQAAEALIGIVVMAFAVRLLLRWRRGHFHVHPHRHRGVVHRHLPTHGDEHGAPGSSASPGPGTRPEHGGSPLHEQGHSPRLGRSGVQAYAIGLVHGVGGSAGVGVLLLAAIDDRAAGIAALALFALFTAVSMAIASTAFGYALARGPVRSRLPRLAPVLGALGLAFGAWYALGALEAVPYVF